MSTAGRVRFGHGDGPPGTRLADGYSPPRAVRCEGIGQGCPQAGPRAGRIWDTEEKIKNPTPISSRQEATPLRDTTKPGLKDNTKPTHSGTTTGRFSRRSTTSDDSLIYGSIVSSSLDFGDSSSSSSSSFDFGSSSSSSDFSGGGGDFGGGGSDSSW